MGSSRTRKQFVTLYATTLEGLKNELQEILGEAMNKQPADKVYNFNKVPMSCVATLTAGSSFQKMETFAVGGILQDFITHVPKGIKGVVIRVKIMTPEGDQVINRAIPEGDFTHDFKITVRPFTTVSFEICIEPSKVELSSTVALAYTFQERPADETGTTKLIGTF